MRWKSRLKRLLRQLLEGGEPTVGERRLLRRIDKLEQRMRDLPSTIRHELRDQLQLLKQVQSDGRRLERGLALLTLGDLSDGFEPQRPGSRRTFSGHERQVFSQNGEDGILLHIFEKIGTTNKRFVEIGAGGLENNTNNLFFNFGWAGFWIDMDEIAMERLASFVARNYPELRDRYRIHIGKVLPESVDSLIADYCRGKDPDLLTIDVDSFDAQVLAAITSVRPRVLACEYNAAFGLRSVRVPFSPDFSRSRYHRYYYGASLTALTKIATDKGYSLIGCDSYGVNCFFVRNDANGDAFPRLDPEGAFVPNRRYTTKHSTEDQWAAVSNLPLEEV